MTTTIIQSVKRGVMVSVTLAVSSNVFAQAPVVNATDATSLEQRIVVLERIVKSRTEMQHRLQSQLDNMQSEANLLAVFLKPLKKGKKTPTIVRLTLFLSLVNTTKQYLHFSRLLIDFLTVNMRLIHITGLDNYYLINKCGMKLRSNLT